MKQILHHGYCSHIIKNKDFMRLLYHCVQRPLFASLLLSNKHIKATDWIELLQYNSVFQLTNSYSSPVSSGRLLIREGEQTVLWWAIST